VVKGNFDILSDCCGQTVPSKQHKGRVEIWQIQLSMPKR